MPLLIGYECGSITMLMLLAIFAVDALFDVYENERCLCLACRVIFKLGTKAIVNYDYYLPLTLCDLWI